MVYFSVSIAIQITMKISSLVPFELTTQYQHPTSKQNAEMDFNKLCPSCSYLNVCCGENAVIHYSRINHVPY